MAVIERSNVIAGAISRGGSNPTVEGAGAASRVARADYDFAVDGGAVSTINLIGSAAIPANAVIIGATLDVITALVGATSTASLGVEAAGDAQAAASATGAPWSTTGRKALTTGSKTTVARDVQFGIGTSALTAGKFALYLEYVVGA